MAVSNDSFIVVFVTTFNEEHAAIIGRTLVEKKLAACVNVIGPIRSIYRWNNRVEDEAEHLVMIKTRTSLFPDVEARIRKLHTYDNPEIIAVNIQQGSLQYLQWLEDSTLRRRSKPAVLRALRPEHDDGEDS